MPNDLHVLHLVLAAVLSSSAHPPLFTPPKGFARVSPEPGIQRMVERDRGTVVETFRRDLKVREPWLRVPLDVPYFITIARATDRSMNADFWGISYIALFAAATSDEAKQVARRPLPPFCRSNKSRCAIHAPSFQRLASHAVRVCGGQHGWLISYTFLRSSVIYYDVFVRAGSSIYEAHFDYDKAQGDPFHVTQSLTTLCPAGAGDKMPVSTVPIQVPSGWTRTDTDIDGYETLGVWYHLRPGSNYPDLLTVDAVADSDEYFTPQQAASAWAGYTRASASVQVLSSGAFSGCAGEDAWMTRARASAILSRSGIEAHGIIVMIFAYQGNVMYAASYRRFAQNPPDLDALRAVKSVCPRAAASAAPIASPAPPSASPASGMTPSPVPSAAILP